MVYKKTKYPDGSFYMTVTDFSDPIIRERINSYEDLWMIGQLKDICDHNRVKVHLDIPCLLDAQADKRFEKNESSNLKMVCEYIRALNFESVSVFHPHNAEAVEAYLPDVIIKTNFGFISWVVNSLRRDHPNVDDMILVSTDTGGFKPLMKLADKLKWEGDVFAASKARKYEFEKSILTQLVERDDFQARPLLIIDDLCVYGGTFIGLHNAFRQRNAGDIMLAVSHMTVQTPNPELNKLNQIFTTNSKFDSIELNNVNIYDQWN